MFKHITNNHAIAEIVGSTTNSSVGQEAVTTKTIEYVKKGSAVSIRAGSMLTVDTINGVGLFNGDHFDISDDEYHILSA